MWHSTDSVLYLERLVEEQSNQINYLKNLLETERSRNNAYSPADMLVPDREMPKPLPGREKWSSLAARMQAEMRKKNDASNRSSESSD